MKSCKNCGYSESIAHDFKEVIIAGQPYKRYCVSHGTRNPIVNNTACELWGARLD